MFEVRTGLRVEIRPRVKWKLDKVMPFCSLGAPREVGRLRLEPEFDIRSVGP